MRIPSLAFICIAKKKENSFFFFLEKMNQFLFRSYTNAIEKK